MPSWNIHTAHVERLLAERPAEAFGIADVNAFLFGNYVPDLYLGFMVPDTTYRIDYCITHHAHPNVIPVPDADHFWDFYIYRRRPKSDPGLSLALGAWAHLLADRFYNARFRAFSEEHNARANDELRLRKQADFDLFGSSLSIASQVRHTPELEAAAFSFKPYSILPEDLDRAIAVATGIVRSSRTSSGGQYQLLDEGWMRSAFEATDERLLQWLEAWQRLESSGRTASAAEVRAEAGLPPATSYT